jgi:hypothetical protein
MTSLPETTGLTSLGQIFLECLLKFLGLLQLRNSSLYHRISSLVVLFLSMLALIYEAISKIAYLNQDKEKGNQLVTIIDLSQYVVKSFCTLVILGIFWRKSSAITDIMDQLSVLFDSKLLNAKAKENRITGMVLVAFILYNAVIIGGRAMVVINRQTLPGQWDLIPFPFIKIDEMQDQILILFLRNSTESMRLLCSGYLALLLHRFAGGLAVQCELQLVMESGCCSSSLTRIKIQRAWKARERALMLADAVENELGVLIGFIMLTDIVSINSSLASSLFGLTLKRALIQGVSFLLYVTSFLSVSGGLIALIDRVSSVNSSFSNKSSPH